MLNTRNLMIGGAVLAAILIGFAIAAYLVPQLRFWVPVPPEMSFKEEYRLALKDYEGNKVVLREFKYDVLVAHVWASWCPYCADELKNLSDLKAVYGDEVEMVGINRGEPLQDAKAFTDKLDLSGVTLLLDPDDAFFKSIGGYAMPETVFIDSWGTILYHQRGPMTREAVEEQIKKLLE